MSKVIKIGDAQYAKLKAMADSHGVPMSKMFNALMNNIKSVDLKVRPEEISADIVVDEGFKQLVESYPTLAQVEEGKK